MIVTEFLALVTPWRSAFQQERTFRLAIQLAISTVLLLGRHTVSQRITLLDRHREDWNKFYRLFSRRPWSADELFQGLLAAALPWCPGDYLPIAADDTIAHKTGKHVHNVGYLRDPLSPKFRHNLVLGLRYLQLAVLLPLYAVAPDGISACALPIGFRLAAVLRKPKGPLSEAAQAEFAATKAKNTLTHYLVDEITRLRTWLDTHQLTRKIVLVITDNGYCNSVLFSLRLAKVHLLARARGNYRLYHRDPQTGRPVADDGVTPEAVRKDPARPWQQTTVQFGGHTVTVKYKDVGDMLWPGSAGDRVLRLLVVAGLPYRRRKSATLQYRQPGYLLTTDLTAPVDFLLQRYFDRWQIEVTFRDEKTILGVGEAQVHTQKAVEREPAFAVASYSAMKLASLKALRPTRTADYPELPAWYAGARRPSCEDLIQKMRREAWEHPEVLAPYGVRITPEALVTASRA